MRNKPRKFLKTKKCHFRAGGGWEELVATPREGEFKTESPSMTVTGRIHGPKNRGKEYMSKLQNAKRTQEVIENKAHQFLTNRCTQAKTLGPIAENEHEQSKNAKRTQEVIENKEGGFREQVRVA
jgi:hypothetical protein